MKKFLYSLIIAIMILGCNCAFAETQPKIYFANSEFNEKTIGIYSNVKTSDYDLVAVAYNGNSLVKAEIVDIELSAGVTKIVHTGIDWSGITYDRAKFFVWKGLSPVCESAQMFVVDGVVTDVPYTLIANEGAFDPDMLYQMNIKNIQADGDFIESQQYLGKNVKAVYNVRYGRNVIVEIEEKECNSVFELNAGQLADEDDKIWEERYKIGYKEIGSSKVQEIALDERATLYVNYKVSDFDFTTKGLASYISGGGHIEFISNDEDDAIEVILLTAFESEAVMKSIPEYGNILEATYYSGSLPEFKYGDEVDLYIDGEWSSFSNLSSKNVINCVELAENYYILYASTSKLDGFVESYDTTHNVVTIAESEYLTSPYLERDISDIARCGEGTFFFNAFGEISYYQIAQPEGRDYVLITSVYEVRNGVDTGFNIEAVHTDESVVQYRLNGSAGVYDADGNLVSFKNYVPGGAGSGSGGMGNTLRGEDDGVFDYYRTYLSYTDEDGKERATVADFKENCPLIARITTDAYNRVTKIILLEDGTSALADASEEYDSNSKTLGNLEFDKDSVAFVINSSGDYIDVNSIKAEKVTDYLTDGQSGYNLLAFDKETTYGGAVCFETK